MDKDNEFNNLPILVPVWNSSVSKCLTIEQNRFKCELMPDFGGIGFGVEIGHNSTSIYEMKNNILKSSNFYPKFCCLPIISRWDQRKQRLPHVDHGDYFPNSSCLDLDEQISCILYTDIKREKLFVSQYVEEEFKYQNVSLPSIFKLSSNEVECDIFDSECGIIREVVKTTNVYGSPVAIVKQDTCLTFLELVVDELNDTINISILCKLDSPKIGQSESLYQFASCNELLPGFVAVAGQVDRRNGKQAFLMEYDLNEDKDSWQSNPECGFKYPVGIHWTHHPRIIAYGETNRFGVVDVRIDSHKCYSNIIKREDIRTINKWERFRLVSNSPTNDNQHLIATDCFLCIYDIRFPKGIVFQWSHTVNSEDSLNFLKKSGNLTCDNLDTDGVNNVIAVANQCDICLFSTKSLNNNCVNPKSLHPPLHVSKPCDCYSFSHNGNTDVYEHVTDVQLIGLNVLQSKCGYSVFQLTNKGDVFVQDFYHKDILNESEDHLDSSWCYSTAPEELCLPEEVIEYIVDTFKATEDTQEFNGESTQRVCQCCEIVCKVRDENIFDCFKSDIDFISNGEMINGELVDFGDLRRMKMRQKRKGKVKEVAEGSKMTADEYVQKMADDFWNNTFHKAAQSEEVIEESEMNEFQRTSVIEKLIDIWREQPPLDES